MKKKIENIEVLIEREELFNEMITNKTLNLEDPRRKNGGNIRHLLEEILLVWLCGLICELYTYTDIEWNAALQISFFRRFYPYKYGAPSRCTIARLIAVLDPKVLESLLQESIKNVRKTSPGGELQTIAIDGKTNRGTQKTDELQSALHVVSAFDTNQGITLAQEIVPAKKNEIIAIKTILPRLNIKNKTITIDAMGTQKDIAQMIRDQKANYILAVKENQKTIFLAIQVFFNKKENQKKFIIHQENNNGHGRSEVRTCYAVGNVMDELPWLINEGWADFQTIIKVTNQCTKNGITTVATRYFMTNLAPDAEKLAYAIRSHWSIESMHWTLDVSFREDDRIVWNRNLAQNESTARRIILNMLKGFRESFKKPNSKSLPTFNLLRKILYQDYDMLESFLRGTFK